MADLVDGDLREMFTQAIARTPSGQDLVGVGADLSVATLLAAYAVGVFPMGTAEGGADPLGWWSPDPRGVLPLDNLRVSRSLRRSLRTFEVRVDTAFDDVVGACADPARPGAWITPELREAYRALHLRGRAHSVEIWRDDVLAGGLFGVSLAGLFAGESMFHRATDASKAALVALVDLLSSDDASCGDRLIDVQWSTPHLASLGVVELPRSDYLDRLKRAMRCAEPAALVAAGRG